MNHEPGKCEEFVGCDEIATYHFILTLDWTDPTDTRPREVLFSYCEKHKTEGNRGMRQISKEEYETLKVLQS